MSDREEVLPQEVKLGDYIIIDDVIVKVTDIITSTNSSATHYSFKGVILNSNKIIESKKITNIVTRIIVENIICEVTSIVQNQHLHCGCFNGYTCHATTNDMIYKVNIPNRRIGDSIRETMREGKIVKINIKRIAATNLFDSIHVE